jgi:hypothetical protein
MVQMLVAFDRIPAYIAHLGDNSAHTAYSTLDPNCALTWQVMQHATTVDRCWPNAIPFNTKCHRSSSCRVRVAEGMAADLKTLISRRPRPWLGRMGISESGALFSAICTHDSPIAGIACRYPRAVPYRFCNFVMSIASARVWAPGLPG